MEFCTTPKQKKEVTEIGQQSDKQKALDDRKIGGEYWMC